MVPLHGTTPVSHSMVPPQGPGSWVPPQGPTPGSWSHFSGMPPRGEASTNEASESLRRVLYWHGFTVTKSLLTALFDFILPVMCVFCFGYWPARLFDYLTIHIRLLAITITEFWFAELFWVFFVGPARGTYLPSLLAFFKKEGFNWKCFLSRHIEQSLDYFVPGESKKVDV